MRRTVIAIAGCVLFSAFGCRRDAGTPLARETLFPDAGIAAPPPPSSSQGSVIRAESVVEVEPNDGPTEAQAAGGNAVIEGSLGPRTDSKGGDAKAAESNKKTKKSKGNQLLDADWYRLPATPPGQITTLDLRKGPPCAELELYDDTGRVLVKRGRWWKNVRPVIASVSAQARASLVRVSCQAKASDATAGGAYQLAVWTRVARPDEELEPNDKPSASSQALVEGATLQGSLTPLEDTDVFALVWASQPGQAPQVPSELLMWSVAGVPDVELEAQIIDGVTQASLMTRHPGKGNPLTVANIDAHRLGDRPMLVLRALSGAAPDSSWAMIVQPFLPAGCAKQSDCAQLLPTEREPNDDAPHAFAVALAANSNTQLTGLIDSPGDVDWYELPARPGAIVTAKLTAPPELAMQLQVGEGEKAPVLTAPAGQPLVLGGWLLGAQPLRLRVGAQGQGSATNQVYRLELHVEDAPDFELESGDEVKTMAWSQVGHGLLAATLPTGANTWQRRGALVPQADVDGFALDLRARPANVGLVLSCFGDGAPGLRCEVQDAHGAVLASVRPTGTDEAKQPFGVAPSLLRIVVHADPARFSAQPYRVALTESPEFASLTPVPVPLPAAPSPAVPATTP